MAQGQSKKKKRGMRMKNSIKKFFAVCAAVTAISAVSAVTVNAAGEITAEPVDASTVTVKQVSGTAVSGETTILLLKGDYVNDKTTVVDDDILYINQDDAATATATGGFLADAGVLPKEDLVAGETYTVRVADQTGAFMYQVTFTVDEQGNIMYGDVDSNGAVDTRDALAVVNHYLERKVLTGDAYTAANVNADSAVDTRDALMIMNYYLEKISVFPAESKS